MGGGCTVSDNCGDNMVCSNSTSNSNSGVPSSVTPSSANSSVSITINDGVCLCSAGYVARQDGSCGKLDADGVWLMFDDHGVALMLTGCG